MTEIAIREDRTAELAVAAPSGLVAWALEAKQASLIAQSLATTAFVPKSLRVIDKQGNENMAATASQITAAILTGKELGLEPMAALRSIDIIEGTPALRANTLRGIVQAHGHDIWVEESNDTRAVVRGRRAGSDTILTSTWTIDRAKKLNLTHKQNWQRQPQAMLVARATSEMARWVGGDVIVGMPYAVEELADGDDTTPVDLVETAVKPAKRTAKRAPVERAAMPEPELEEPAAEAAEPVATEEDEPISEQQMKLLQKLFNGIPRDERLQRVTQIIGREVSSATELAKWEASRVIDQMTPVEEPPADMEPDFDGGAA